LFTSGGYRARSSSVVATEEYDIAARDGYDDDDLLDLDLDLDVK
jgi:hypothetical protein